MKKFRLISTLLIVSALLLLFYSCSTPGTNGVNGKDGENGADGINGKDGLTP